MSRRVNQRVKANRKPATLGELIPDHIWSSNRTVEHSRKQPKGGGVYAPHSGESPQAATGPIPIAHPI